MIDEQRRALGHFQALKEQFLRQMTNHKAWNWLCVHPYIVNEVKGQHFIIKMLL